MRWHAAEEEEALPEASLAIMADALVVSCARLGPAAHSPSRRRTRFCPASVDVFAWPMDLYDTTDRCSTVVPSCSLAGRSMLCVWHR